MAFFDLPLHELETYNPPRKEPTNFDAFWAATLEDARKHPLNAVFTPFETGLSLIEAWDVTYSGYGGQPIKGWYIRPANVSGKLPCVIDYIGYGGGRGHPSEWLFWANAGYANFVMDTRGQGTSGRTGDTPDIHEGGNPFYPGFMTQGILSPETYYYRRVFTDAARAVEAARTRDDVDTNKIILTGASQGGGITIAAAALVPDVALVMPDVPFLCHFRRATTLVNSMPYGEIVKYLTMHRHRETQVFETLGYFDGMNFATRIKARTLFSVGLMDDICPPSTVYAAYNGIQAPKDIKVYTFNNHEGGGHAHALEKLKFLRDFLG